MTEINTYLAIITLDINGLNYPIKRNRLADWVRKTRLNNLLPTRNTLAKKDRLGLKMKGRKKIFISKGNLKASSSGCTPI
jgi:hypothetical protein